MFPLDPRTLERVADLVCDIGGPFERRGYELERLLRHAGWQNPPEYDGSPRVPWLLDALTERAGNRADMERFLCRVCDPREYDDGMATAQVMREHLNAVLEPERLTVSFVSGRPVLAERGEEDEEPVFTPPEGLEQRLRALIKDQQTVELLVDRVVQSRKADEVGAHLLAVVGIGSFVEGLLYQVLVERCPELLRKGFRGRNGKEMDAKRAGLQLLIETAHAKGLIELDAKTFMDEARNFRNYIHPRQQMESKFFPDRDTVRLCWGPVRALLNDLENALIGNG